MKNEIIINDEREVNELFVDIKKLIEQSRNKVYRTVNTEMVSLYWNVGKRLLEKQEGKNRAGYGDYLLNIISEKLIDYFGKGFSIQNLRRMRQFYICFPIRSTLSSELSWSHYLELIKIVDESKRNFYMNECIDSK